VLSTHKKKKTLTKRKTDAVTTVSFGKNKKRIARNCHTATIGHFYLSVH
jgi:hypothetical protein